MTSGMFSMTAKRIVVTGAAGHLGRELCIVLGAAGATVYAIDQNVSGLEDLQAAGANVTGIIEAIVCDLSEESGRVALAQELASRTSYLDGVVFAAAFVGTSDIEGWAVDFAHQSLKAWRDALELNLTAPFHLAQLMADLLVNGNGSSIVNVGSIYGSVGPDWSLYQDQSMSNPAGYGASKGGLLQLTRWLSSTLAPDVRVNCVSPGGILRGQPKDFVDRYVRKTPLGRMATEADIVGAIVFLLSAASAYITGQEIIVDGGLTAI